jgi:hypothetical protein
MKVVALLTFASSLSAQSFIFQLCDYYGEYNQQFCTALQAVQGPKTYPTPPVVPGTLGTPAVNSSNAYLPPSSTLMHNRTSPECTKCTTCGPTSSQCKYGCELTKAGASKELISYYWALTNKEVPCINPSLQSCQTCGNSTACENCFSDSIEAYKKCYLKQTHLPDNIADSTVECYSKCNLNSTLTNFFECSINCYRDVYAYLQLAVLQPNFTLASQDNANSTPYNVNQFFNGSFCFNQNDSKNNSSDKSNATTTSPGSNHSSGLKNSKLAYQYGFTVMLIILLNLL